MSRREYAKAQMDTLPDDSIERVIEFIAFQQYSRGLLEDDTAYLDSIPGMKESLLQGMATPLSDCVPLSEVWPDV
jgi:hypothetical protein